MVPKSFNIIGKSLNNNNEDLIIPTTAYRLGYYVHRAIQCLDYNKKNIVLEIGGGFGLTGLIFNRNMKNSCYIIVDIPTTAILSAYFLIKMGLKVCLFGEHDTENYEDLFNKYDIIIIHPTELTKFNNDSIDLVINTASFIEMSDAYVHYYIEHISRISKRMYDDNHFQHDEGRQSYNKYCNKYLNNFNIIYKQITPINFLYPPICGINGIEGRPFEEVLRVKNE